MSRSPESRRSGGGRPGRTMTSIPPHGRFALLFPLGLTLTLLLGNVGCTLATPMAVRADRYRIEVVLNPARHYLRGRATLDLSRLDNAPLPLQKAVSIELALHPNLRITRIYASGAKVKRRFRRRPPEDHAASFAPAKHVIILEQPAEAFTLVVEYRGELRQDVAAGEAPGQIHNLQMRAHIGNEGIYLADGYWYPQPALEDDAEPAPAEFVLLADRIAGMELVAGAERDPISGGPTGRLAWKSSYPLTDLVLVGGRHEIHHTLHRGIPISVHLKPDQAQHASGWLNAVGRNLDRYEPLIGPYPAGEYAVVDNFFSSGFAFPMFTLLSPAVIQMGERAQTTHGYLDHEMLHSWWGNGIFVDPRDGNWCESLASYAANYYGYVLDGDDKEARRKRRNYSHFLSRIKPQNDKPLGTYGRPDGCSRSIAYNKGAAVFHMLARKMGQENFWAAMRQFTKSYVGRHASWEEIRNLCEAQCGASLETFFRQWVRGGGAPQLQIDQARYHTDEQSLTLTLSQTGPVFDLDLPIRINHADGKVDISVSLNTPSKEFAIPLDVVPVSVEVDPDFHLFRKVSLDEIIPTTASTRSGSALTTVLPTGHVPEKYRQIQSLFESSFEQDGRRTMTVDELQAGALAERCVLILGEAVRHPYVSAFLGAIDFPVRWTEDGFEFSGVRYANPGDAVLCTARHPGVIGGGVTVLYANSPSAIPNPALISMYDRSLVIFEERRPTVRKDFELSIRVPVEPF
ncbi:MAG: hypothetical protein IID38_07575 [Planctomycetes bacterium]|nr:hypothetical protein [Planctomycetota bacterium]